MALLKAVILSVILLVVLFPLLACIPVESARTEEEKYQALFSSVQNTPGAWGNANLGIKGRINKILVGDIRDGWEEWQGKLFGSASGIIITELQPYAIEFDILETDDYIYGVYVTIGDSGIPWKSNILVPVRYLHPSLKLKSPMFMDFKVQGEDIGDFKGILLSPGDEFYGRLFVNEREYTKKDFSYGNIAPMWRKLVIQ